MALKTPSARCPLPPTRGARREEEARDRKQGCEERVGARLAVAGGERRGWGPAAGAGKTRPGSVRGRGWARAPARRSQARRLALLPVGRRAPAPSLTHTAARLARSTASRLGHRASRRVGSQPAERPRARPGPPSGWPSGLRRCVQVAVSPGGVGSNPTPDKPAFWPALWQRFTAFQSVRASHSCRLSKLRPGHPRLSDAGPSQPRPAAGLAETAR